MDSSQTPPDCARNHPRGANDSQRITFPIVGRHLEVNDVTNTRSEMRLSKVPKITLVFWIIKIAATTLG